MGFIYLDYHMNIMVLSHNSGTHPFQKHKVKFILQMVFYHFEQPKPQLINNLTYMDGGKELILFMIVGSITNLIPVQPSMQFDIWMSSDPFDSLLPVDMGLKVTNKMLDFLFKPRSVAGLYF